MTKRSKIPHAGGILYQVDARTLQAKRVDLDLLMQQRHQLHGDVQFLRFYERRIRTEMRIVSDGEVLHPKPGRKEAKTHITQYHGAAESTLQLCLDCSAVFVDIECRSKYQNGHDHDENNNSDNDSKFSHGSLSDTPGGARQFVGWNWRPGVCLFRPSLAPKRAAYCQVCTCGSRDSAVLGKRYALDHFTESMEFCNNNPGPPETAIILPCGRRFWLGIEVLRPRCRSGRHADIAT